MRWTTRGLVAWLWVAMLGWPVLASPPALVDFFTPVPNAAADLPADRVFPQGRRFPLVGYGAGPQRTATLGFTMVGSMYRFGPEHLAGAAEHNVGVVASIQGGWSKDELALVSPEQVEQAIRREVEQVLAWEHADRVSWWYLRPEELRYWRSHEIQYLELAANTIRQTDPQRRPVWMYDPGHRGVAGLIPTARHLDVVGKGMYTNYSSQLHQRVWCRWTIDVQNQAIEQANPGAISIAVPEMFRHPGDWLPQLADDEDAAVRHIHAWVRHDVYASLISGAKGVAIFAMSRRRGNPERGQLPFTGRIHEAYEQAYAQVAGELTGPLDLGQVFLFGQRRSDLRVHVLDGPPTVRLSYRDNEPVDYPAIGHLDVAYGDARYLILVNSTGHAIRARIEGLPAAPVRVDDLFNDSPGQVVAEGQFEQTFEPWGVVGYRLSPGPEAAVE